MQKINYAAARKILSDTMDSDLMDIGRKISIVDPDGYETETDDQIPMYTNIPCNLSIEDMDNPDLVGTSKPKIQVFFISCSVNEDIRANDFIVVKRKTLQGDIEEKYAGMIGEPVVTKLRKIAMFEKRRDA